MKHSKLFNASTYELLKDSTIRDNAMPDPAQISRLKYKVVGSGQMNPKKVYGGRFSELGAHEGRPLDLRQ